MEETEKASGISEQKGSVATTRRQAYVGAKDLVLEGGAGSVGRVVHAFADALEFSTLSGANEGMRAIQSAADKASQIEKNGRRPPPRPLPCQRRAGSESR